VSRCALRPAPPDARGRGNSRGSCCRSPSCWSPPEQTFTSAAERPGRRCYRAGSSMRAWWCPRRGSCA